MKRIYGRKRLSRQEAQAQTRERLIEAAKRLFIQRGFAGTSLRDIAEEAGYSQGAFYSNFSCKEAVMLELLKRHVVLKDGEFDAIVSNKDYTPDQILVELEIMLTRFETDQDWSVLAIELQLCAMRSPSFAESYAAVWHEHEKRVATMLKRLFERLDQTPPAEVIPIAKGLIALTNGLVVQQGHRRPNYIAGTIAMFLRAVLSSGPSVTMR